MYFSLVWIPTPKTPLFPQDVRHKIGYLPLLLGSDSPLRRSIFNNATWLGSHSTYDVPRPLAALLQ